MTNLAPGQFYGKLVESDFTSFKARMKGYDWPDKYWEAFADVSPEQVTANYRRIQQEARSFLPAITLSPPVETPKKLPNSTAPSIIVPTVKPNPNWQELTDEF